MRRRLLDGIEREIPHLRRYARALTRDPDDADDLVQDTLERAIARLDQFQPGTDLRSWMFTIMHNLFIDGCRRARRRGESVEIEDWMANASAEPSQLDAVTVREVIEKMDHLSPHEREVLEKVAIDGMKYEEAAAELGVAVGTVKSRLFRARESLKRLGIAA
ncbi:MAG: DNA-directed RNA polymerase sigma-70 factor [Rhodothalassiaceae bacterium]|nr:MAG: DNA-directed RNA polymerase sigma-70 factor [Rhodothalassiaceae bacterium]